jgi:putative oxidoreductase
MPYAGSGFFLQRLFSTFPNGWPGIGILLQRVLTATTLFCYGIAHLRDTSQFASIVPHMFAAAAGILLLLGLWTPIVGALVCRDGDVDHFLAFR